MTQLDISKNYNGKLFCDHFSHLILFTPEYQEDMEVQITQRSVIWGVGVIVRVINFPFSHLKDSLSYIVMGKPSQYLAAELNKQYNYGKTIEPNETLMHLVIGWKERNMEVQGPLLSDWWQSKNQILN